MPVSYPAQPEISGQRKPTVDRSTPFEGRILADGRTRCFGIRQIRHCSKRTACRDMTASASAFMFHGIQSRDPLRTNILTSPTSFAAQSIPQVRDRQSFAPQRISNGSWTARRCLWRSQIDAWAKRHKPHHITVQGVKKLHKKCICEQVQQRNITADGKRRSAHEAGALRTPAVA